MKTFDEFYSEQKSKHIDTETIKRMIDGLSPQDAVISFDIFDTLLVRPSMYPTDILILLQKRFKQKYDLNFYEMRRDAESLLGDLYTTLDGIWDFIAQKYHLSAAIRDELQAAEIQLESDLCVRRNDVAEIYEYVVQKGFRLIAVSDMYLPQETLRTLLQKNGYGSIGKIYVSCEERARKSTGDLFDVVLQAENLSSPSDMIHIGDHFESDYTIPLRKGVHAIYYPSIWEIAAGEGSRIRKIYKNPEFSKDACVRLLISYSILYRYFSEGDAVRGDIKDLKAYAEEFIAPVTMAIACNLCNDENIRDTYQQVNFAARDGYLPLMVYNKLAPLVGGLPGNYLYVSRMALSWTGYDSFADMLEKSDPIVGYNLENYLKVYIDEPEVLKSVLAALSSEEREATLEDKANAVQILSRMGFVLQPYFSKKKSMAKKYYGEILETKNKRSIVFDCGYSGSVSYGLMKATDGTHPVDKYYLWETDTNRERDQKYGTQTLCLFSHDYPNYCGINLIYEELFSPLVGTCTGFREEDGKIEPVFEKGDFSDKMKEDCKTVRNACLAMADRFIDLFHPYLNEFLFCEALDIAAAQREQIVSVQCSVIGLFRDIRYWDKVLQGKNISLENKVHSGVLNNMLRGTGFDDSENYITEMNAEIPEHIPRLAIHLHLYNTYLYEEILLYLREINLPFDLIVTVVSDEFGQVLQRAYTPKTIPKLGKLIVVRVENRGRDVAPWIIGTKDYQDNYDLICHIHGKASTQNGKTFGDRWRNYLFANLISPQAMSNIITIFNNNNAVGCIWPKIFRGIEQLFETEVSPLEQKEKEIIEGLLQNEVVASDVVFSAGTMLWYRTNALKKLFQCGISLCDFEEEPLPYSGTLAHAIERCPAIFAKKNGYESKICTFYPILSGFADDVTPQSSHIGLNQAIRNYIYNKMPWNKHRQIHENTGIKVAFATWMMKKMFGPDKKHWRFILS